MKHEQAHPDAPHGFDRDGSHAEGRYVCTCEYWEPPQPEALRLADALEDFWGNYHGPEEPHEMNAAVELRRLHAENSALRNSLATDEALMRQALEALIEQRCAPDYQTGSAREADIAALRERLRREADKESK